MISRKRFLVLTVIIGLASISCQKTAKLSHNDLWEYYQAIHPYLTIKATSLACIDPTGNMIIKPQFDDAYFFSEGLGAVKQNDKWGFVDKAGKIVINCQFQQAVRFSEGLAAVKLDDKWGYIDKTGKLSINYQFDGHQYVIETALKEVDELIVMVYDSPEVINIPLSVRANWISWLYSQYNITVMKCWASPQKVGYTDEIKKMHEDYILSQLKGKQITHFYSSELYGEHVSKALNAINRLVDISKLYYPVSATMIRNNPLEYKSYIDDMVYSDIITNVVFLGGPSTGKTTIAERAAKEFNTVWMPEYGREYWEQHQVNKRLTNKQLTEIAWGHLRRENHLLLKSNKYLFTDTNAIITEMFSKYYNDSVNECLKDLSQSCRSRYDVVFVCDTDIPYEDTWDRSGDVNRKVFQRMIIDTLQVRKIPYTILSGSIDERLNKIKQVLSNYRKV